MSESTQFDQWNTSVANNSLNGCIPFRRASSKDRVLYMQDDWNDFWHTLMEQSHCMPLGEFVYSNIPTRKGQGDSITVITQELIEKVNPLQTDLLLQAQCTKLCSDVLWCHVVGSCDGALTPPGARRVDVLAWKTLGGSFPTLEYVMTDEELNEWAFESVDMFSWNTNKHAVKKLQLVHHSSLGKHENRKGREKQNHELTKFLCISSILFLTLDITLSNMPKGFLIMSCKNTKSKKKTTKNNQIRAVRAERAWLESHMSQGHISS